jgi:HD-GYP domain-containing protein (c-di-GMP phosphodiesterase class II)
MADTSTGVSLRGEAIPHGHPVREKSAQLQEMRETYNGVLMLLRHFISKDEYTEHHSHRVSLYATRIAAHMSLSHERIEDVRAASLLHDIGKLQISRGAFDSERSTHHLGCRRV